MLVREIWDGRGAKDWMPTPSLSTLPSWSVLSLRADPSKTKHLCSSLVCTWKSSIPVSQRQSADTWGMSTKYETHLIYTTTWFGFF